MEGRVLEGKRRERAIKEHLEWLAGRLPSEAARAERHCRLTALAVFAATRKRRKNGRRIDKR